MVNLRLRDAVCVSTSPFACIGVRDVRGRLSMCLHARHGLGVKGLGHRHERLILAAILRRHRRPQRHRRRPKGTDHAFYDYD